MYDPENSVPSSVTCPPVTRVRTTQNLVSSTRCMEKLLTMFAVTMTWERSSLMVIVLTSPTSTFLYLIFVLPGSKPSAALKVMVIVGPCSRTALIAIQPPIRMEMIGTSHTK